MRRLDDSEIEKISKEYTYVQVKVTMEALERLDGLSSSIPSRDDRALPEIHIDLDDYCDLGENDPLVEEIQKLKPNIGMIVFYA